MVKISASVNRNTSYVYHMLSVAKIGYDNDYGQRYRALHDRSALQALAEHGDALRVQGGQHAGLLYAPLIALPATLNEEASATRYYAFLEEAFSQSDSVSYSTEFAAFLAAYADQGVFGHSIDADFFASFRDQAQAICASAAVMRANYAVFCEDIWPTERALLEAYVLKLNDELEAMNLAASWQKATGYVYQENAFQALICNSMLNGPQAIDISSRKDVFQRSGDVPMLARFISHEFGIYTLRDAFFNEIDRSDFAWWPYFESLAGYFNRLICDGDEADWRGRADIVEQYAALRMENPMMSPHEMFFAAQRKDG